MLISLLEKRLRTSLLQNFLDLAFIKLLSVHHIPEQLIHSLLVVHPVVQLGVEALHLRLEAFASVVGMAHLVLHLTELEHVVLPLLLKLGSELLNLIRSLVKFGSSRLLLKGSSEALHLQQEAVLVSFELQLLLLGRLHLLFVALSLGSWLASCVGRALFHTDLQGRLKLLGEDWMDLKL